MRKSLALKRSKLCMKVWQGTRDTSKVCDAWQEVRSTEKRKSLQKEKGKSNARPFSGLDRKGEKARREISNAWKQAPLQYGMIQRENDCQEQNQIIWPKYLITKYKNNLPRIVEHWAHEKWALRTSMDRWVHKEQEASVERAKTKVTRLQRKPVSEEGWWSI